MNTTYIYETIPTKTGEKTRCFEIRQAMNDTPLTKHPETSEPIRRVILGGYGVLSKSDGGSAAPTCGCGPGGCCASR